MYHRKSILNFFVIISLINSSIYCSENDEFVVPQPINLISNNIDQLVIDGISYIKEHGDLFEANAGSGQQAYDVNYILTNPLNRVHTLRGKIARRYFCRELLAYFNGSLKVHDGLEQASSVWKNLADDNGNIASNYGYYIFHQQLPHFEDKTQYDWIIFCFLSNPDSRKALININQPCHKINGIKDYPCTVALQFFIRKNKFCCNVMSRSTDIFTGLPYDMGFFSFLTELLYKDLKQKMPSEISEKLNLGYVMMKTNFTQIYDKTRTKTLKLLETPEDHFQNYFSDMPEIVDAQETLSDIYNKTSHTSVMKWIYKNAKFEN